MPTSEPSQLTLFAAGLTERTLTTDGLFTAPTSDASTRTCRYSQGGTALGMQVAASTSSPPASPASRSHTPGSDWARRMTAISGRRLLHLLPISAPVGACLRTWLDTSRWGSTTCWLTWKRSATPGGRSLYRLVPSAPRTGETGFGFWPTPNAALLTSDTGLTCSGDGRQKPNKLGWAVSEVERRLWLTPRAEGFDAGAHRGVADSLRSAVKLLPTPQKADGERGSLTMYRGEGNPTLKGAAGGELSAAWVNRMMGYPDGFLD